MQGLTSKNLRVGDIYRFAKVGYPQIDFKVIGVNVKTNQITIRPETEALSMFTTSFVLLDHALKDGFAFLIKRKSSNLKKHKHTVRWSNVK